MKLRLGPKSLAAFSLTVAAGLLTASAWTASDPQSGDPAAGEAAVEIEPIELLDADALETLVAPVALYPDDLLAVVLPASTYPLQVVLAARFLAARPEDEHEESETAGQPSEEWDDSVIALLNYPEVVAMMDTNLDWSRRLGEAVLAQEEDVIAAISAFRQRAKEAGNLTSDGKQEVAVTDAGAIEIKPAVPDEIYVPYYEPAEVVERQPVRVYHYYPRSYPVYYYPYHQGHDFAYGSFWGVTSAFSIGWHTHNLHLHHYGFNDHPYYSRRYYDPFYYRRPHLVLNVYDRDRRDRHRNRSERHHRGNDWRSERSQHDQRRWASRIGGRPGEGRGNDRRRRADRDGGGRSDSHAPDRRRWAGRDNRGRGEGRGNDRRRWTAGSVTPHGESRGNGRHRKDPKQRAQPGQDQPIAHTLQTGATATVHRPTRITPLGEVPPRPTAGRTSTAKIPTEARTAVKPPPVSRAERRRPNQQRPDRRRESARLPQSQTRIARPVATRPLQRPDRAPTTRQTQRTIRPGPAAVRDRASLPQKAQQIRPAGQRATERAASQTTVRPQSPRTQAIRAPQRIDRTPRRAKPAPSPRMHAPKATSRLDLRPATRQARPRPSPNRATPTQARRPSPAARQTAQRSVRQTRTEPRFNRQAPTPDAKPAQTTRQTRAQRPAPQRPVRSRPGRSGDDFRSRRPR